MSDLLSEQRLQCPFCAESISVLVDTSAGSLSYIEDCQVCCQPMQITIAADDGELHELRVDCGD